MLSVFGRLASLALAAQTGTSTLADSWGGDDGLGFAETAKTTAAVRPRGPIAVTGFLRTDNAAWVERLHDNPFAKSRQSLDLRMTYKSELVSIILAGHGEYDLAYLVDRSSYDRPTLNAYEWQLLGREMLAAFSLGSVELTVGRQIVAWGEGQVLSPVDVVNPRDLREPGLADLDDLRMPVLATRLGWFAGAHRIEAMAIHEASYGLRSPPRGPFSLFAPAIASASALVGDKLIRYADSPGTFTFKGQQLLLRYGYRGNGIDLGLYAASILLRDGVISVPTLETIIDANPLDLTITHPRYTMLGHSGAIPAGDFVVTWEATLDINRSLNTGTLAGIPPPIHIERRQVLTGMAGLAWTGLSDTRLALEVSKSQVLGGANGDEYPFLVDRPIIALRVNHDLLRERLSMSGLFGAFGLAAEQGWLARIEASYELADAFHVGLGYITYHPRGTDGPIQAFTTHDRVFFKLRWDFSIL